MTVSKQLWGSALFCCCCFVKKIKNKKKKKTPSELCKNPGSWWGKFRLGLTQTLVESHPQCRMVKSPIAPSLYWNSRSIYLEWEWRSLETSGFSPTVSNHFSLAERALLTQLRKQCEQLTCVHVLLNLKTIQMLLRVLSNSCSQTNLALCCHWLKRKEKRWMGTVHKASLSALLNPFHKIILF